LNIDTSDGSYLSEPSIRSRPINSSTNCRPPVVRHTDVRANVECWIVEALTAQ